MVQVQARQVMPCRLSYATVVDAYPTITVRVVVEEQLVSHSRDEPRLVLRSASL